MSTIAVTVMITLLGVGIGIALGLLIASMRTDGKSEEFDRETRSPRADMKEIVRIWQMAASKDYLVEFDEKIIESPSELSAGQSIRLLEVIEGLQQWVSPAVSIKVRVKGAPQVEEPLSPQANTASEEVFLGAAGSSPGVSKINPIDVFTNALRTDVPQSMEVASIAAQVDEILQEKLEGTALESRGIRLMEFPNKGLVVMVGLDQYDRVEDVPNPEIRNLIRSAVEDWEHLNWKD